MITLTYPVKVTACLDDGVESFIRVEGLGLLSLSVAKQLFADLDEEIAQADTHEENQSTGSPRLDYYRAVAA